MLPALILFFAILASLWAVEVYVSSVLGQVHASERNSMFSFGLDLIAAALWALFYYITH